MDLVMNGLKGQCSPLRIFGLEPPLHSCTLLKTLDEIKMRCYLARRLVWTQVTLLDRGPGPPREGARFRVIGLGIKTPSQNLYCKLPPNGYR